MVIFCGLVWFVLLICMIDKSCSSYNQVPANLQLEAELPGEIVLTSLLLSIKSFSPFTLVLTVWEKYSDPSKNWPVQNQE